MSRRRPLLLPALALLFVGCGPECTPFEIPSPITIEAGIYASPLAELNRVGPLADHPWMEGEDFTLSIDRAAGEVTLRYTRGGRQVEEVWRIAS